MTINLDKNMDTVKELLPDFYKWIVDQPDVDWLERDGDQLYVSTGVTSMPMYPLDDPLSELDGLEKTTNWHKETCTVVVGIGLGHALHHILGKMEKGHHVVIVEPVGHAIRLAFSRYDFSAHIRGGSLIFAPGRAEIDMAVAYLDAAKVVQDWGVLVDRVLAQRSEYWKLTEHALELLNSVQCNTGTVMAAGAQIADNDIATLPWVIRHRGVRELVGLFAGKPAIVVSTGPSLARNIHLLRAASSNAVIIAVGQALRPLLAYDVRPDFICTVDFGEVNMTHFDGICDETVPLVTINKAYAPLLKRYRGPKFISAGAAPVGDKTAHSVFNEMGELAQGGSVAHMAYGLAANLGCDPVIFVGQDLALSDASHFNQADSAGGVEVVNGSIRWKVDDPRSKTLHGRDDLGMGPAQQIAGWWGVPVLTNTGLAVFVTAMERLVAQYPGKTINCTEGGCHMKGTRRMFLADALAECCKNPIDKSALAPLLTLSPDADRRVDVVLPLLKEDIRLLDILIEHSGKGIVTVQRMRNTTNQGKIKKLLEDNAKHSLVAHECAKKLPLVALAIFWASRRIEARDLKIDPAVKGLLGKDNRKDLVTRLDRNDIILKAARDAGRALRKTYAETGLILAAYVRERPKGNLLDPTGEIKPADLSDAEHYLSIGNFSRPLLEARRILHSSYENIVGSLGDAAMNIVDRALAIRSAKIMEAEAAQVKDYADKRNLVPQYMDLLEDSRAMGRDDGDMEKALDALRKATAMLPECHEAWWGLASSLLHLERYAESVEAYEKLLALFPDHPRYIFEYGQALILAMDTRRGLDSIAKAMAMSDEFDHFFGGLAKLYAEVGLTEEAKKACSLHLEKYPHDRDAKTLLANLDTEL